MAKNDGGRGTGADIDRGAKSPPITTLPTTLPTLPVPQSMVIDAVMVTGP
jgi:hypothetical protein